MLEAREDAADKEFIIFDQEVHGVELDYKNSCSCNREMFDNFLANAAQCSENLSKDACTSDSVNAGVPQDDLTVCKAVVNDNTEARRPIAGAAAADSPARNTRSQRGGRNLREQAMVEPLYQVRRKAKQINEGRRERRNEERRKEVRKLNSPGRVNAAAMSEESDYSDEEGTLEPRQGP